MTRRKFLSAIPLAMGIPAYGHFVEPHWFQVQRQSIPMPALAGPVRIAQLSDLHASVFVPFSVIESSVELALAERPDVIVLTGDYITNAAPFDANRYARILRRLADRAPVYATLGNHDGGSWSKTIGGFADTNVVRNLLANSGAQLLHNTSRLLTVKNSRFNLAGVGDLWNKEVDEIAAFRNIHRSLGTVLLAHNPDTKDIVGDRPWDLMLSGHTHGGQVIILGVERRFVPVEDKRYIAGFGEWSGRNIYVTRGVGSLGGIRLNCRPEVTVIDLIPTSDSDRLT